MKKIFFVLAAVTISSQLHAQQDSATSKPLDEIIITANKFPQKQSFTGKVMTVINQQQLQNSLGKSVGEILNEQVGITVNGANNTLGANQVLYMRGAAFANTLILIDGVPLNDASAINSEFDLNTFPVYQVERIEILKGAQSTLYGSDAVAGVINIISKKAGKKSFNTDVNLSAGSFGTYRANLALSGNTNKTAYHVSYSHISSKGISSAYDSSGTKGFDDDGYMQNVLQGNFTGRLSEKFTLRLLGKLSRHKADIDAGAFTDDKDYSYNILNALTGIKGTYEYKKGALNLLVNYNYIERKFTDDSGHTGGFSKYQQGNYKGKTLFAEIYNNYSFTEHAEILTGIDLRRNATNQDYLSISSFGPFKSLPLSSDTAHTSQFSAYASFLLKKISGFYAELGGRWNNHSLYGNNFTSSFNPSYLVNEKVKLFANIASAYRVPSLYQLYSEYGNRELKPERSVNYEAGLQFTGKDFHARATAFKRNIRDVFIFYTDFSTFQSIYKNEDRQEDKGLELEAGIKLFSKLNLSANYTYVDGKIFTSTPAGKDTSFFNLYRRPKHTFNVNAAYQVIPQLLISAHLRNVSKFYEPRFAAAPLEMKGYYTIDLYSSYRFSKALSVFAELRNITDQQYFDIRGFNTKPLNFNTGINCSF
ncbi:MAG: TonB-dependent receptor [Chitinophagaceae bacterium]|nr:TonB-dependent receptor [Chitinophagaceae bacterium]